MADTIEPFVTEFLMLGFDIDFTCSTYRDYRRGSPPGMIVTHWYDGRQKQFNLYTSNRMYQCESVAEVLIPIVKIMERWRCAGAA